MAPSPKGCLYGPQYQKTFSGFCAIYFLKTTIHGPSADGLGHLVLAESPASRIWPAESPPENQENPNDVGNRPKGVDKAWGIERRRRGGGGDAFEGPCRVWCMRCTEAHAVWDFCCAARLASWSFRSRGLAPPVGMNGSLRHLTGETSPDQQGWICSDGAEWYPKPILAQRIHLLHISL